MADTSTDLTLDTTTTLPGNEAIPTSVTATPVDTIAAPVDTTALLTNTSPLESSSFPAATLSDSPALISPSSTTRTLPTSSRPASRPGDDRFHDFPPFFDGPDGRPPFATGSAPPFFFRDQSNGLSTGAKAGIGVGVAALALSILAVTLLILRMRKKEKVWAANTAPPPTYEESNTSAASPMQMGPKPAMKLAPAPLMIKPGVSSNNSPILVPIAPRNAQRKSRSSMRPRRNSNLAPVSEEEPDLGPSNLALVNENGVEGASTNTPPRTPRTTAFHALTGEYAAPSPGGSSFHLEPLTFPSSGNTSPLSSEFDKKSPKSRR